MAENTVLEEALTDAMIDAGAQLIRTLDGMGVAVTTALWLLDTEINEWRLLLGSPVVSEQGPRVMYRNVGSRASNSTSAPPRSSSWRSPWPPTTRS